jgi:hypothetical protein
MPGFPLLSSPSPDWGEGRGEGAPAARETSP